MKFKNKVFSEAFSFWKRMVLTNKIINYRNRRKEFEIVRNHMQIWRENVRFQRNFREFHGGKVERRLLTSMIAWKQFLDRKDRKARQTVSIPQNLNYKISKF